MLRPYFVAEAFFQIFQVAGKKTLMCQKKILNKPVKMF